ncbi:MAG: sugar ABC transporter ATP-binding protein [Thermoproteota archaeon]|nr:MAG: sugar ABC transporter ATP-binding protein [Candidatus Korarchaeota archaeon]
MARVVVRNLTKKFGNVTAVNRLTLDVRDGEFVVLLGPSGCGKTTTLRCIAGLEAPDEGEIYIGDKLVNELPPKDRNIAMVFQSYALYPHMKVYDNIAFPLKMRKYPKSEIDRRVREVARLLKIEELLDRKPKQLSGGQQQRVALGRALVREPDVFLMDEPLSNLDAKLRVYMRAELKRLQRELKVTTIYVTHDQVEAMTMADRIAVMNNGVLQQYAEASEIYSRPSTVFVAGFIGSPPMNFIECTLVEEQGEAYLDAGAFRYKLSEEQAKLVREKASSSELLLGVRPEHITLHLKPVEEGIKGRVYVVEPLGAELIVNVKIGESILKVKTPVHGELKVDQEVWVSFNRDRVYIFDKRTEESII